MRVGVDEVYVDEGGKAVCTPEGHFLTVTVHLEDPLAGREVVSEHDGWAVDVFDGTRVRVPVDLPADFELLTEHEAQGNPRAWRQVYGPRSRGENGRTDSTYGLEVLSGDQTLRDSYGEWLPRPSVAVGGEEIEVRQDPDDDDRIVVLRDVEDGIVVVVEDLYRVLTAEELAAVVADVRMP